MCIRDRGQMLNVDRTMLIYDLLREAPCHLREGKLPVASLEDVIDLVDSADAGSMLPRAVLAYHMEAYNEEFSESAAVKPAQVNGEFMPASLVSAVKNIWKLD